MKQNQILSIQYLRGIAAMLVVLFHLSINYTKHYNQIFLFDFFQFGKFGVDIFFVLSGFIITYSNRKHFGKSNHTISYIKKRLIRIGIPYWVVIIGLLVVFKLLNITNITSNFHSASDYIKTFLLWPYHTMVNGVSWTLSYELFFYLLFTITFIVPNKNSIFFTILILLSFIFVGLFLPKNQYDFVSFICSPVILEFIFGIIIALLLPKINFNLSLVSLVTGIILFISGVIIYYSTTDSIEIFNRIFFFGFSSAMIILGSIGVENNFPLKDNFFSKMGECSYSMYLIHLPILSIILKITKPIGLFTQPLPVLFGLFLFMFILFLSWYFYLFIEKRIIKLFA